MPEELEATGPADHHRDAQATKERLLEAAVRLFAANGFQGTSVRAVTQAAGTSVSAANYHFGSKEEMLGAAIRMRAEPLNRRRLEALEALERTAGESATTVEEIVGAFVRPVFELRAAGSPEDTAYRGLAARLYLDTRESVAQIRREIFEPVNDRFCEALHLALPGASRSEIDLALQLAVAVLVHLLSRDASSLAMGGGMDAEELLSKLVAFAAAGIGAVVAVDPANEFNEPEETSS